MGKFINPFTDFGFKHIFGREMDKEILIEFLNDLLEGEHTIKDLRIMNNERLAETEQGTAKGKKEEKCSIALNLKKMGLSMEQIATATGLSREEIGALK